MPQGLYNRSNVKVHLRTGALQKPPQLRVSGMRAGPCQYGWYTSGSRRPVKCHGAYEAERRYSERFAGIPVEDVRLGCPAHPIIQGHLKSSRLHVPELSRKVRLGSDPSWFRSGSGVFGRSQIFSSMEVQAVPIFKGYWGHSGWKIGAPQNVQILNHDTELMTPHLRWPSSRMSSADRKNCPLQTMLCLSRCRRT